MPSLGSHGRDRVLVTGGAGFIGSHLVERLVRSGETVVVIDDCSTGTVDNLRSLAGHPALRIIPETISRCTQLNEILKASKAVYHLAAAVGVELVMKSSLNVIQTNVRETEVLLEAASAHGVPVLLASTSEVYGKSEKEAFHEDDNLLIGPPRYSRWSYACSKLMDEFLSFGYAHERSLPVVVARLFNTVGPRQTGRYGMVLPRFIAAAGKGEDLQVYGDGLQTRCFCYVEDTVEALCRLQHRTAARAEVFNVGSTEEVSIRHLAESVITILHSTSDIVSVPYETIHGPSFEDMRRRKPVIDKLARVTGFRPATPLRTIIERTAEAMFRREEGTASG